MKRLYFLVVITFLFITAGAQRKNATPPPKEEEGFVFTPVVDLKATSVKNQASTGTCWWPRPHSLSELMRDGE
jgi:hypothetical protein